MKYAMHPCNETTKKAHNAKLMNEPPIDWMYGKVKRIFDWYVWGDGGLRFEGNGLVFRSFVHLAFNSNRWMLIDINQFE